MIILLFIYLLTLVCWLGAIIFFSFFTAPVLFTRLPLAEAGKVVSTIFPRYYALGYVAGIVGTILALCLMFAMGQGRKWWGLSAAALGFALACTLYAGLVLRPRVDAIRSVVEEQNPDPARKAEFDRLHRLSVILNGAVFVLDLVALFTTAGALSSRG
jgi:Domain of unknown function (DUF4149)